MEIVKSKNSTYEQILEHRKKLSELKKKADALDNHVKQTIDEIVKKYFQDMSDEISELDGEIEFLETEKNISEEEENPVSKGKSDKEIKEIFHIIARHAHPDKVGDKFLQEFQDAVEAYEVGDIDTLEQILEIVDPNSEKLYTNISQEKQKEIVERLERSIAEERERIREIKSSHYLDVVKLYETDSKINEIKARHLLSTVLFGAIVERTKKIDELNSIDDF